MKQKFIWLALGFILLSCHKEAMQKTTVRHLAPYANAGGTLNIYLPADSVVLSGSGSSDPDGRIVTWSWKQLSGPALILLDSNTMILKLKNLVEGVFKFELSVTDNDNLISKDTTLLEVNRQPYVNHPPVAKAGPDQFLSWPTNSAFLDGSHSFDPDGNTIQFDWRVVGAANTPVFSSPFASQTNVSHLTICTTYIQLTVTDNFGWSSRDTVKVFVTASPPNDYLPLTEGSYWSYTYQGNSIYDYYQRGVTDYSPVFNGKTYYTIIGWWTAGTGNANDSGFYRKENGIYYEYKPGFIFGSQAGGEIAIMKDNVVVGSTWQSDPFSLPAPNPAGDYYLKATVLQRGASMILGGFNFNDVMLMQYEVIPVMSPQTPYFTYIRGYAKNVGLVYMSDPPSPAIMHITGYIINF